LKKSLEWRLPKLKKCFDPFSKPCPVSKAALSKDSFTFTDGVSVKIEPYQLDLSIKLSEKLALDEVEAFTFLRSFLYLQQYNYTPSSNGEGFSKSADSESALLDAASDFYFEERIFILRVFIPLYRAYYEHDDPHHDLASDILKEVAPDTPKFIASIIAEYVRRTKQEVPPTIPHTGASLANRAKLAKQIVREQICMIEVVFWATYHFRSPGSFVAEVYEAVYSSSLGTQQKNQNLLIDKESSQLIADLQSVIILTAVQLLSVDLLYEQGIDLEVVSLPRHGYFAQPEELVKIHRLVYSTPTQPRYSPIVLAWTCVIRRLALAEAENANYPEEYVPLMELLVPDRNARDSVWQEFTRVILNPAMDLFGTIRALLASPLLNSEAAAELGSSISNPNDTIVRAIIKGFFTSLVFCRC
jgi:nuclear pore complex protein Nup188